MVLVGCSSTSSVPEDDKLFTGLRKTGYENYEPCDHFYSTQEEVEAALATTPNGALFGSPYYRIPSYRLWIYNAFEHSRGGIGKWMRTTCGKAPVLLSSVNPQLHAQGCVSCCVRAATSAATSTTMCFHPTVRARRR